MPKLLTKNEIIKKAVATHGNTYNYDKVNYINSKTPVTITCKKHGDFRQTFNNHVHKKAGCPKCGQTKRKTNLADNVHTFLEKVKRTHGDRYDYSKVEYVRSNVPVSIICKVHGEFRQRPANHISGAGCPVCNKGVFHDTKSFIEAANTVHGFKYDYSKTEFINTRTDIIVTCPKHGDYNVSPRGHLKGHVCRECYKENYKSPIVSSKETFASKANVIHKNKYTYNNVDYRHNKAKVSITCPTHGDFIQRPNDHLNGAGCPKCVNNMTSEGEKEVSDFVESLGFSIKRNIRTLFKGSRKEADIFIPAKNLIIEYDGNVWHSKKFATDQFNVRNKTRLAEENGYECMHIRSDQWNKQKDLVKSLIKSRLGIFEHRIGARQTVKRDIGEASYKKLADENHLQGYRPAKYRKGLFYKDTLVACISYDDAGELVRYVVKNGWQIQGALPKLIKNEPITHSFCDLTFFSGKSYPKAGFKLAYITKPNYRYVNGTYTVSRNSMMKHKLEKQLDTFDPNLTEEENCANNGWYKLYDCGNAKFVIA